MALRIEQDSFPLLDIREDEFEKCGSGFRLNLALQRSNGRLVALDQRGDDGGIRWDRGWRAERRRRRTTVARKQLDDVPAIEDGPERIADQRIASAQHIEQSGASRGRRETRRHVHE